MIKKLFFTGLATLLPVAITVVLFFTAINFLTKPFLEITKSLLYYFGLQDSMGMLLLISRFLILMTLLGVTLATGLLARLVAVHYLIRFGDYIIHRIPIINKIYKAAQHVVTTLLSSETASFSQVVLVPFPHSRACSIGLITGDHSYQELVSVFVPTTPNPTVGILLLAKRSQLTFIDMKVDDAIKAIVSCGAVLPSVSSVR